ncbi:MAG: TetR/AcrR family transcriptional regulator, partial [Actinomycetota bacterium]
MPRTSKKPRKLGRPPATDSAETRRRILAIARETFAVHGYEVTTNRDIANQAGVTPAALYHYVPSKADLYVAVLEDAQGLVSARFNDAVAGRDTFL